MAKPFVKWAGGKGKILNILEDRLPATFNQLPSVTYVEPFVGGGAMLFHMLYAHHNIHQVIINDINETLIDCYHVIREQPQALIDALRDLSNEYLETPVEERDAIYYQKRDAYNAPGIAQMDKVALFMFLNRTCFNGLYRVNKRGLFNVPTGRYVNPNICNETLILEDSHILNEVDILFSHGDYSCVEHQMESVNENTFVYIDPPYRPISKTAEFRKYSNSPFNDRQQEELKQFCDRLSDQGHLIMISNSDSRDENGESYFEHLYGNDYRTQIIQAPRYIKGPAPNKGKLHSEVLITNY